MEHRLFGTAVLVASLVPALLWGGGGRRVAGGVVSGTLLGPEGSGVFLPGFSVRALPAGRTAASSGVVGAGVWWGSARILRTTQWTRASL